MHVIRTVAVVLTALVALGAIHGDRIAIDIDERLVKNCAAGLASALLHTGSRTTQPQSSPGSGAAHRSAAWAARRDAIGALWACHHQQQLMQLAQDNTSSPPAIGAGSKLRILVWDLYAPWLVPALERFSELYGIPLDLDVQPFIRLMPSICTAKSSLGTPDGAAGAGNDWRDKGLDGNRTTVATAGGSAGAGFPGAREGPRDGGHGPRRGGGGGCHTKEVAPPLAPPPGTGSPSTSPAAALEPHALWLYPSSSTQQLALEGHLLDIGHLVQMSAYGLDWYDVRNPFRLQLAPANGRTVAVPLDGDMLFLFYRLDVLAQLGGLQVPQTWTDLIEFVIWYDTVAANVTSDSPFPAYPLCVARGPDCHAIALLQAIWASISQTRGSAQPIHFDPVTNEPLIDSPGASAALRIAAQLLAASAPLEPEVDGCDNGSGAFARGRCALALSAFAPQMRLLSRQGDAGAVVVPPGRVSIAPLPGSDLVAQAPAVQRTSSVNGGSSGTDAARGTADGALGGSTTCTGGPVLGSDLVACTPQTCPFARPPPVWFPEPAPHGDDHSLTVGSGSDNGSNSAEEARGRLVNRAPQVLPSTLVGGVNARLPLLMQFVAFEALSYLASPDRYDIDESVPPLTSTVPVRRAPLQPGTLDVWLAAGYDGGLTESGLPLLALSVEHPNVAWGLQMAGQAPYTKLLDDTLAAILAGNISADPWVRSPPPPSEASGSLGGRRVLAAGAEAGATPLAEVLAAARKRLRSYYPPSFSGVYNASLQPWKQPGPFLHWHPPSWAPEQADTDGGRSSSVLAPLLGTLLPALVLLGCAAAGVAWWRLRRRRDKASSATEAGCLGGTVGCGLRRVSRKMHVPSVGAEVALCVTDIQDSTTLWELLPADVIARAVDIHHRCVRRLALRHGGYESATEGDSFILAFDSVRGAVAFALELQSWLLVAAPWPRRLLEQGVCKPVYTHLPPGYPLTHSSPTTAHLGAPAGGSPRRPPDSWVAAATPDDASDRQLIYDPSPGSIGGDASNYSAVLDGAAGTTADGGSGVHAGSPPLSSALVQRHSPFHQQQQQQQQQQQPPVTKGATAAHGEPLLRSRRVVQALPSFLGRSLADMLRPPSLPNPATTSSMTLGRLERPAKAAYPADTSLRGGAAIPWRRAPDGGSASGADEARHGAAAAAAATAAVAAAGKGASRWRKYSRGGSSLPPGRLSLPEDKLNSVLGSGGGLGGLGSSHCIPRKSLMGPPQAAAGDVSGLPPPEIREAEQHPLQDVSEPVSNWTESGLLCVNGLASTVWRQRSGVNGLAAYCTPDGAADGGGGNGFIRVGTTSRLSDYDEGEGEGADSTATNTVAVTAAPLGALDLPSTPARNDGLAGEEVSCNGGITMYEWLQAAARARGDGEERQQLPQAAQQLMFRGLRVRVGISVAVPTTAELQYNNAAARMVYGGPSVAACKALADLAHGGQVLLSERAHQLLLAEYQRLGGRPPGTMILQMGLMETLSPPASQPSNATACGTSTAPVGACGAGSNVSLPVLTTEALAGSASGFLISGSSQTCYALASNPPVDRPSMPLPLPSPEALALDSRQGQGQGQGGEPLRTPLRRVSEHHISSQQHPNQQQQEQQQLGVSCSGILHSRSHNLLQKEEEEQQQQQQQQQQRSLHSTSIPRFHLPSRQLHHNRRSLEQARQALGLEPVYWVTSPALSPRLALLPPLRFPASKPPPPQDVYRAPLGCVSYVVVRAPAAGSLLRWNSSIAVEAMRVFVQTAVSELRRAPGSYLVSATPAEVRAAFPSAVTAVAWALRLRGALLSAPWPQELLEHRELGEPVEVYEAPGQTAGTCGVCSGSQPAAEAGTPRPHRWSSLAAFSRASFKDGNVLRAGNRGATLGATPGAVSGDSRVLRTLQLNFQHWQHRRSGARYMATGAVTRAELPPFTGSEGEPDKFGLLGRIEASTPLRRNRHSIDSYLPLRYCAGTTAAPCTANVVNNVSTDGDTAAGSGVGYGTLDGGMRQTIALAQLASHLGYGPRSARSGAGGTGTGTGGSLSANGYYPGTTATHPSVDGSMLGRGIGSVGRISGNSDCASIPVWACHISTGDATAPICSVPAGRYDRELPAAVLRHARTVRTRMAGASTTVETAAVSCVTAGDPSSLAHSQGCIVDSGCSLRSCGTRVAGEASGSELPQRDSFQTRPGTTDGAEGTDAGGIRAGADISQAADVVQAPGTSEIRAVEVGGLELVSEIEALTVSESLSTTSGRMGGGRPVNPRAPSLDCGHAVRSGAVPVGLQRRLLRRSIWSMLSRHNVDPDGPGGCQAAAAAGASSSPMSHSSASASEDGVGMGMGVSCDLLQPTGGIQTRTDRTPKSGVSLPAAPSPGTGWAFFRTSVDLPVPGTYPPAYSGEALQHQHLQQKRQLQWAQQGMQPASGQGGAVRGRVLLLRGLRIHIGISTGVVDWSVNSKTHALTYTGRTVNRAVRLSDAAHSGNVLCDKSTQKAILSAQQRLVPTSPRSREPPPREQAPVPPSGPMLRRRTGASPSAGSGPAVCLTPPRSPQYRQQCSLQQHHPLQQQAQQHPPSLRTGLSRDIPERSSPEDLPPVGAPQRPSTEGAGSGSVPQTSGGVAGETTAAAVGCGGGGGSGGGDRGSTGDAGGRTAVFSERTALSLQVIRYVAPRSHHRLTVRLAEEAYVCELVNPEASAGNTTRLQPSLHLLRSAHVPSSPFAAPSPLSSSRPRVAASSSRAGLTSTPKAATVCASIPRIGPQRTPTWSAAATAAAGQLPCGSAGAAGVGVTSSVISSGGVVAATIPFGPAVFEAAGASSAGRARWAPNGQPSSARVHGSSDCGVEPQVRTTLVRKAGFGSCPGLDIPYQGAATEEPSSRQLPSQLTPSAGNQDTQGSLPDPSDRSYIRKDDYHAWQHLSQAQPPQQQPPQLPQPQAQQQYLQMQYPQSYGCYPHPHNAHNHSHNNQRSSATGSSCTAAASDSYASMVLPSSALASSSIQSSVVRLSPIGRFRTSAAAAETYMPYIVCERVDEEGEGCSEDAVLAVSALEVGISGGSRALGGSGRGSGAREPGDRQSGRGSGAREPGDRQSEGGENEAELRVDADVACLDGNSDRQEVVTSWVSIDPRVASHDHGNASISPTAPQLSQLSLSAPKPLQNQSQQVEEESQSPRDASAEVMHVDKSRKADEANWLASDQVGSYAQDLSSPEGTGPRSVKSGGSGGHLQLSMATFGSLDILLETPPAVAAVPNAALATSTLLNMGPLRQQPSLRGTPHCTGNSSAERSPRSPYSTSVFATGRGGCGAPASATSTATATVAVLSGKRGGAAGSSSGATVTSRGRVAFGSACEAVSSHDRNTGPEVNTVGGRFFGGVLHMIDAVRWSCDSPGSASAGFGAPPAAARNATRGFRSSFDMEGEASTSAAGAAAATSGAKPVTPWRLQPPQPPVSPPSACLWAVSPELLTIGSSGRRGNSAGTHLHGSGGSGCGQNPPSFAAFAQLPPSGPSGPSSVSSSSFCLTTTGSRMPPPDSSSSAV